jgi:hypothetical protein
MSIWKANVGSRQAWRITSFVILVLAVVWPGLEAIYWHAKNVVSVSCGTLSITIPILWSTIISDGSSSCATGVSLIKHAPTIFGSESAGSTLTLLGKPPLAHSEKDISSLQEAFGRWNTNVKSYALNDKISQCWKGDSQMGGKAVKNVLCELPDEMTLRFSGSESALAEIKSMIR